MTEIIGIAAVARNGVIGSNGDIPWRIPEDWQRFKQLTTGHVLIMGRKTYDSIGRPLPDRITFVITRDRMWRGEGVRAVPLLDEAFEQAVNLAGGSGGVPPGSDSAPAAIFVAGGGEIYRAAWSRLTRLEITEVDQEPAGDVTFPRIDPAQWRETAREVHPGFTFVSYQRV